MGSVLFAPHNLGDDETLFAFYQCLHHKPKVIVVLRSFKQWIHEGGPSYRERERETGRAMKIAGCEWEQWVWPDTNPDWTLISREIETVVSDYDIVIAPAWELGGHDDHNAVANIVDGLAPSRLVRYLTYRKGSDRSRDGDEVEATEEERALKLQALECYASQAAHRSTAAWFNPYQYGDLGEWVVQ